MFGTILTLLVAHVLGTVNGVLETVVGTGESVVLGLVATLGGILNGLSIP